MRRSPIQCRFPGFPKAALQGQGKAESVLKWSFLEAIVRAVVGLRWRGTKMKTSTRDMDFAPPARETGLEATGLGTEEPSALGITEDTAWSFESVLPLDPEGCVQKSTYGENELFCLLAT
jgi:hypothetical protein